LDQPPSRSCARQRRGFPSQIVQSQQAGKRLQKRHSHPRMTRSISA
jgi:hypothetical protein